MRSRLRIRSLVPSLTILSLAFFSSGCGNAIYVMSVDSAEGHLEQAQSIDAQRYAPYEYYSAQARVIEAKHQAAEAEYGYAISLADAATRLAREATAKAKIERAKAVQ